MTATHTRAISLAALGACLVAVGGGLAAQNPPAFRGRADMVTVDVSVRQRGRPVTGLTAADFEIFDNGAPQPVAGLVYETLPIDVTVALDVSESVSGPVLNQMRQSVRDLVQDLTPSDRLRLLTFNAQIKRLMDFGAPRTAIDSAFDSIRAFGGTAVFDTIAVALATPAAPDRRQLVVVFSDGDDQSSVTRPVTLLDVVHHTTPTLGLVFPSFRLRTGGTSPPSSPAADARAQMYAGLAKEAGGFVETVNAGQSLGTTFRRMLQDFRQSYVLYFSPDGADRSAFHTLDVRVRRNGVDVRARRGYATR
jgi:VWFA-related protein